MRWVQIIPDVIFTKPYNSKEMAKRTCLPEENYCFACKEFMHFSRKRQKPCNARLLRHFKVAPKEFDKKINKKR